MEGHMSFQIIHHIPGRGSTVGWIVALKMCKPQSLEPVDVALFENRIFAHLTKDLKMRPSWIEGVS